MRGDAGSGARAGAVLAIDLGKTGCRAVLFGADGRAGAVRRGPGAPGLATAGLATAGGVDAAEAAIRACAGEWLERAGRIGIGAAGAAAAPDAAATLARRIADAAGGAAVAVASDAVTAHAGGLGGEAGVVLAVGTGAVAAALGPDGVLHLVDGLGPWLGDEGGGASLGLDGLRRALRAADGRGPPTALRAAMAARFGSAAGAVRRMAGDGAAAVAAGFAPDVLAAAAAGDGEAGRCVDAARGALEATVRAAGALLPGPGGPWPLAVLGGMAGTWAGAAVPAGLRERAPAGTALDGARLLAEGRAPLHEARVVRAGGTGAGGGAAAEPETAAKLDALQTEGMRPGTEELDLLPPAEVVALALAGERAGTAAMARAAGALGEAANAVAARMRAGGRLFTLGAGTSGRLAVLDAAELGPTFSVEPGLVIPLLAGGPGAMLEAVEGAEDDPDAAGLALDGHGLGAGDAVVGIAASGRTPFVLGGLRHARARGALTVAIVNNPNSPVAAAAAHRVEILTGPELVGGSTRMCAGTAQKVALNALSTAAMVALGKTFGGRMVDVRATNAKLRRRAVRTVTELAGCGEAEATAVLDACGWRLKPALLATMAGLDAAAAEAHLRAHGGRLRPALEAAKRG